MKKYFLSNSNFNGGTPITFKKGKEVVGIDSGLRNRSLFNPPQTANHQVEVFKQLVLKDLETLTIKKSLNPNHIKEGVKALEKRYCDPSS